MKIYKIFYENIHEKITKKFYEKIHKKKILEKSMKKFFKTKEVFDDKSQMEVFFLDFSYLQ